MCWYSLENKFNANDKGGMGFRSMSSFNEALIPKQMWRIIINKDTLVHKCLKSKYFHNNDINESSNKPNYSHL